MSLDTIRRKIDEVDAEILRLLHRRMELAVESRKYKFEVEDTFREDQVISKVTELSKTYNLDIEFIKRIYQEIFSESKKRQLKK